MRVSWNRLLTPSTHRDNLIVEAQRENVMDLETVYLTLDELEELAGRFGRMLRQGAPAPVRMALLLQIIRKELDAELAKVPVDSTTATQ